MKTVLDKVLTFFTYLVLSLLVYVLGTILIVSTGITLMFPVIWYFAGFGFAFGISFASLCIFSVILLFSYLIYKAILKIL